MSPPVLECDTVTGYVYERAGDAKVAKFCAKIGIRPYRPTYRYLRGDPAKQAAAAEDLDGLKKSAGGRAGAAEPG